MSSRSLRIRAAAALRVAAAIAALLVLSSPLRAQEEPEEEEGDPAEVVIGERLFLETRFARTNGRTGPGAGRPAKLYAPTPERRPLEFPPRRLASIVGRLLDELPALGKDAALRRVGEGYGHEIAAAAGLRPSTELRRGLEAVCASLRSLGFPVTLAKADTDGAEITTPDCPMRPLVRDHPEAAEIDRGMWAALVERGVRGIAAADVRCCTDGCEGGAGCTVTLAFDRA